MMHRWEPCELYQTLLGISCRFPRFKLIERG